VKVIADTEFREVANMVIRIEEGVKTLLETKTDHELRIRLAEDALTRLKTIGAIAAVAFGAAAGAIASVIARHV
jgi:hypothetical protein